MNLSREAVRSTGTPHLAARQRLLSRRGEPLFFADWERALMIHFEVDAEALQRNVPFQLDLRAGRAFVSLVAFTMRGMRPRAGGRLAAWLFRPIATHHFLNVRTYVRHDGEPGIHFLTEWLSNLIAVRLGPATFCLPYRHGRISYQHAWETGALRGRVTDGRTDKALEYTGRVPSPTNFIPCEVDSLDEWLMERYAAFNCVGRRGAFFRVWHPPWPQCRAEVVLTETSLLAQRWQWFADAKFMGANFSPGVRDVWMGRPRRLTSGFMLRASSC